MPHQINQNRYQPSLDALSSVELLWKAQGSESNTLMVRIGTRDLESNP